MKNKLTNTRVVNSIGIGILAMVTAGTPVLAAINGAMNDNGTADSNVSDIPAEPVDQAAPSQNEQILQTLSDTQNVIREVRDTLSQTPEGGTAPTEEINTPVEMPPAGENAGTENITPTVPENSAAPEVAAGTGDASQTPGATMGAGDTSQTPVDSGSQGEENEGQPSVKEEGTGTLPEESQEGIGDAGNGDISEGTKPETPETTAPTIDEYLEESGKALGNIQNNYAELQKKNLEAQEAVKNYNEAVENPHGFLDSVADIISDASSAVVGAVPSVTEEEANARELAQEAVDAQVKVYEDREAAEAAKQQAQEAAAAAEEAYKNAQSVVEKAAENKQIADDRLSDLESQLSNADAAVRDMEIKVQAAQEMLISLLEQYGLTPGEFDPGQLEGDAKTAYENIQAAVAQAQAELASAQSSYEELIKQVADAKNNYEQAEVGLKTSNDAMQEAVNHLNEKRQEWVDSELDSKIAEYNAGAVEIQEEYIKLKDIQEAYDNACDALNKAQAVKDKADQVLANAQNALDKAQNEEAEMVTAAEVAAAEAKNVDLANEKEIEEAKSVAKEAEEAAKAAADKVKRTLEALGSAEKSAEDAEKDLVKAQEAVVVAAEARNVAKTTYENLLEEWKGIQGSAIEDQIEKVKMAMEPINELEEGENIKDALSQQQKYELACELILYKLLCEGKAIAEVKVNVRDTRNPIIKVEDSDGIKTYRYSSTTDGAFNVFLEGDDDSPFISIDKFNESAGEIESQKESLDTAKSDLKDLEGQYTQAVQAQNKAEVVAVLVDMRDALKRVGEEAEKLIEAETAYKTTNEADKLLDTLSTALNNLAAGGKKLNTAKTTSDAVKTARDKLEEAIENLAEFTVQEEADQEAYQNLLAAYEKASADHTAAVEALKQCVSGLNRVQTQKDRARIAADAIFDYISGGNENPSTPTPPDTNQPTTPTPPDTSQPTTPVQPVTPIRPVYGTLIDKITSPIIGNTGVSTPSGTGYTGYAYTIGGQPVYAVGETAEPEGEAPEENLVNVEDGAVPLAQVGETNKNKTNNTKTTRTVKDEKVPLADVETEKSKYSWLWILVIALLGATGTELYIRHKEKTEQEEKSKSNKQSYAKI